MSLAGGRVSQCLMRQRKERLCVEIEVENGCGVGGETTCWTAIV